MPFLSRLFSPYAAAAADISLISFSDDYFFDYFRHFADADTLASLSL